MERRAEEQSSHPALPPSPPLLQRLDLKLVRPLWPRNLHRDERIYLLLDRHL